MRQSNPSFAFYDLFRFEVIATSFISLGLTKEER